MLRLGAEYRRRQFLPGLALFLCLFVTACFLDEDQAAVAVNEGGTTSGEVSSQGEVSRPGEVLRSGEAFRPGEASLKVSPECWADVSALKRRRVDSVIDGDTLRLAGGESLRLVGVNTPEMGRDGRRDEPLARRASQALEAVSGPGDYVWLRQAEDGQDRYGRLLAYAYDGSGRSISGLLIAQGLGFHVAVAPNVHLADCLDSQEKQARSAQLGVWSESEFSPRAVSKLTVGKGGFTLIRDRVSRVSFKDNGWWVQLGGKLGLKIAEADQSRFSRQELLALDGVMVETRGWLVPMSGGWWMMKLSHPSLLQRTSDLSK
ncbi:MAG: thermonuclease family protein [Halioglobus sp.]